MTLRKFLIMVEDDVAGQMVFEDSFSYNEKMYNHLINDEITVMEIEENVVVERGDIWDGKKFNKPE